MLFGSICSGQIQKFFIEVSETDEYELIEFKNITLRCIRSSYMECKVETIVISPCMDLTEHD